MSTRLAFQTQLASIMEVLANAAVAEICKLVDDDYAVVSLQMSQCQRENKALKRKLHLLELKMARGTAERRLRESAMNSGRPRVHVSSDRLRDPAPSPAGAAFEQQMEASLWSGRATAEDATSEPVQSESPDVELVEPEAVLVKEEKVEPNMSQYGGASEALVGEAVVESVPQGAAGRKLSLEQQELQSSQSGSRRKMSSSRGVEKGEEPDVVLVKVEEVQPAAGTRRLKGLSIQEGLVESSTDDYRGVLPFDETPQTSSSQLSELQESARGFSETEVPPPTPRASEDSSSRVVVQMRVPDTSPQHSQPRSSTCQQLTSEYSLFELEAFFTRWAPDNESVSTAALCSFTPDDSADQVQDGVIIVGAEPQSEHPTQAAPGSASSAVQSAGQMLARLPIQETLGPSAAGSVSMPPLAQRPWSSTAAMVQGVHISQQQHSGPPAQTTLSTARAAVTNSKHAEKSSATRTMCSTVPPLKAPQVRGSAAAALACMDAASAAQLRVSALAHHSKNLAGSMVPGEHRRKSYICKACGKAFSGLSNLEAHKRVHTGERPFPCNTCGKRFSEAGNLKKHQRVHTGEKPFSCQQCGKRFAWICNLRTHQQSATGCSPHVRGRLGLG